MTMDDKFDSIAAFCEKYEELMHEAPEGSVLKVIKELWDGLLEVCGLDPTDKFTTEAQEHIINGIYIMINAYATCEDNPDLHWL